MKLNEIIRPPEVDVPVHKIGIKRKKIKKHPIKPKPVEKITLDGDK